jgi:DNA-binding transcriptional MerR regulator
MSDSLTIGEVVRRTGLTTRALRFYEARGLVHPLRTAAGRRLYSQGELERIHQIVALKHAGLSLAQMRQLFDRKPIDLVALLTAQREALRRQADEVSSALAIVEAALARLETGEPLEVATLCTLIRDGDRSMKPAAEAWKAVLADWKERMALTTVFGQQSYQQKWRTLGAKIEKALPMDPTSDAAFALVREWFELLQPHTRRASPDMWQELLRVHATIEPLGFDSRYSKQVWDFLVEASGFAWASGKDVAPVP